MSQHRTDLNHTSRRGGRAKAEAAKGGGAPAPALTRLSRPRNHPEVRSGLTDKTVAPLPGGKPSRAHPW
jgi:hypothetical protein